MSKCQWCEKRLPWWYRLLGWRMCRGDLVDIRACDDRRSGNRARTIIDG